MGHWTVNSNKCQSVTSHCVDTVFSWLIWIELFEYDETSLRATKHGPWCERCCPGGCQAQSVAAMLGVGTHRSACQDSDAGHCWVQPCRPTARGEPELPPSNITSPPTPEPETPTWTKQHCTVYCIIDHKICNHYKY